MAGITVPYSTAGQLSSLMGPRERPFPGRRDGQQQGRHGEVQHGPQAWGFGG